MARVVFHVPSLIGGGAERVWVLIANELARRGHDVTLLVWNGAGPNARLRSDDVRLVDFGIPVINDGFGKPATLRGLWRMARWFRRHRPDAVFSAPEFANLVAGIALLMSGSRAKFFPSFHAAATIIPGAFGARLSIRLSGMMAGRATRLIAVSQGVGADIRARGISASKIAVINNPLPPGFAVPATSPLASEIAALGDGPVIVTAGRLTAVKDQATLIRAFAALLETRPARLVVCGDGPLKADLIALARQLAIADRVLFPGYLDNPAACYAGADLFALSSLSEGFGNVLVEAMAAGVPVVSTDCKHGPREILADGAFGELVPIGDAAALAAAMARSLDAPMPADRLRGRANDFSISRIGDQYAALLES